MKVIIIAFALIVATFTSAEDVVQENDKLHSAYGYLENVGIPAGKKILEAEEKYLSTSARIVGGVPAAPGQYPYQAGLISDIVGLAGRGVCGGALISTTRVLTAAHCWFDGRHQAWRLTVVLGSVFLFSGGVRLETSAVVMHPGWSTLLARNDVAVIYLPKPVATSTIISPIALPSGDLVDETFAGSQAIFAGFGLTANDGTITEGQSLNHISLQVITNRLCSLSFFFFVIQDSHICTSGAGNSGPCRGDSGSALTVRINNTNVAIGIASFVSGFGCESGLPTAYARVTSFLSFINQHL